MLRSFYVEGYTYLSIDLPEVPLPPSFDNILFLSKNRTVLWKVDRQVVLVAKPCLFYHTTPCKTESIQFLYTRASRWASHSFLFFFNYTELLQCRTRLPLQFLPWSEGNLVHAPPHSFKLKLATQSLSCHHFFCVRFCSPPAAIHTSLLPTKTWLMACFGGQIRHPLSLTPSPLYWSSPFPPPHISLSFSFSLFSIPGLVCPYLELLE